MTQPSSGSTTTTTTLADILVPFAECASINPRDAANTLKKRIIVSLGFTDTRQLHASLFPSALLDWDAVLPYVQNVSLSVAEWCELVSLLHFIREPDRPKHVTELVSSALAGLKVSVQGKSLTPIESMQVSFARAGMAPTWDILAKSLLLCNLVDVEHAAALHYFLNNNSATAKRSSSSNNNGANIAALISHIGAHRHTPDEYTAAFAGMLSNDGCHVAAHHIIRSLKLRDEAIERVRQSGRCMLRSTQKPSLTELVARHAEAAAASSCRATTDPLHHKDPLHKQQPGGFAGFCGAARLQSNASVRVRRACYYVMALPPPVAVADGSSYSAAVMHGDTLRRIVGDDPVVLAALGPIAAVSTPDIAVLRLFLDEVHHTGAPMRCIRAFRDAIAAPSGIMTAMHWSTVLRLYLAAYSRVPRDLWTHALSLAAPLNYQAQQQHLAPETEKMIRAYVAEHPIALDELLSSLTGDTEEEEA
jgi:hypothetical protein